MSASTKDTSYGQPTLPEKVAALVSVLLHFPISLGWTIVTSPFHETNRQKSWKRLIGDRFFYHMCDWLNTRQMQWSMGTTLNSYETWAKASKQPTAIDELGHDGRLLWVGERRTDKVILYVHGGAFIFAMTDFSIKFWKHVKDELKTKGHDVGLVLLNYSLCPTANFPTPLTQIVLAVQHLISTGISPSNIQIVGDSAGGNLILQLVAHILHPVESVPTLSLDTPLRSVYLMSPWISLAPPKLEGSMVANNDYDVCSAAAYVYWGKFVLADAPAAGATFLEPINAPNGWWQGIQGVTRRVLITAGQKECLVDGIAVIAEKFADAHPETKYVVQENGVHDDPLLDFMVPGKIGHLTPGIVDWLAEGWASG